MNSKFTVSAVLVLCVSGCAAGLSPTDVINTGKLTTFRSSQPSLKVANFIARNADEDHSGASMSGAVRNYGGNPLEVVMRAGENVVGTVVVSQSTDDGSEIKLYLGQLASSLFSSSTIAMLTRGCL